jgi:hypothetical protein
MTPGVSTLTLALLVPLIVWRIYARIRRMVGRQRLSRVRPWITLIIFPLIVMLLALTAMTHPERLGWLAAGLAAGGALAVYGLRKTTFESTPQGMFYTPNAHLGIALSLLFVARIAYRLVEIYMLDPATPRDPQDFARSPLTLCVFGLLAGYYIVYAAGLIRHAHRAGRSHPA